MPPAVPVRLTQLLQVAADLPHALLLSVRERLLLGMQLLPARVRGGLRMGCLRPVCAGARMCMRRLVALLTPLPGFLLPLLLQRLTGRMQLLLQLLHVIASQARAGKAAQ